MARVEEYLKKGDKILEGKIKYFNGYKNCKVF